MFKDIKWFWLFPNVLIILNSYKVNSQYAWRQTEVQTLASYSENCSNSPDFKTNSSILCDPDKNLTCTIANICDCKQESETGVIFIHDTLTNGCSPTLQAKQFGVGPSKCLTQRDCYESRFGALSRCNDNSRCECHDTLTNGQKKVVLVNNVCVYFQNYGDTCETDHECNGTITGEAICNTTNPNSNKKTCICHYDYIWDNRLQECVKIADTGLNFLCRSDLQCSHLNALGELSRCSPETRNCECFDVHSNGKFELAYHAILGKCFYKRKINETCENIEECQLGSSQLAVCKQFDVNNSTKTCHCKENYIWGQSHLANNEDCLPLGKYHTTCTDDRQCYHPNALGELSTCAEISGSKNPRLGHCECWDSQNGGQYETGHYQEKCYFKKRANETCKINEECIVGYHENAICSEHPSYFSLKVCVCPENKLCNSALHVISSFYFTFFALTFSYFYSPSM